MKLVILTGAGLSAESGLGTFRDVDGLWTKYDLAEVATPEGFAADPEKVQGFYNARRANCHDARPNRAHAALASISDHPDVTIITQNVDDLLERAGARNVIHMHGELMRALCGSCGHRWDAPDVMTTADTCPQCGAAAARPDVVWFGEMPYHLDRCQDALDHADLFAAIGTSAEVYPAAGFIDTARDSGARTVEINLAPSARAGAFDEVVMGPATSAVPNWVDSLNLRALA